VKFTGTPADIRIEPPLLGEHTVEVLLELGFSPADAARMAKEAAKA
jgi:crotonobetainyl-CoA:carnitine CoA-transferase CaiB-like acyl-CoA transferase